MTEPEPTYEDYFPEDDSDPADAEDAAFFPNDTEQKDNR